jgi:tRNA-dihydrouridine synthase
LILWYRGQFVILRDAREQRSFFEENFMEEKENKTKEQLIEESDVLRQRVRELEKEKYSYAHTEKELLRVTRALKARSSCNQILIRAKDVSEFLRETCVNIVVNGSALKNRMNKRLCVRSPNSGMRTGISIP